MPVLARLIRAKLEAWIPAAYGELAGLAAVPAQGQVPGCEPAPWRTVFQGPIAERQLAGQGRSRTACCRRWWRARRCSRGEVYLVGAAWRPGPFTFRALRLMQQADGAYDRLVARRSSICRRDAERSCKRRADHAVPQDQINRLLC